MEDIKRGKIRPELPQNLPANLVPGDTGSVRRFSWHQRKMNGTRQQLTHAGMHPSQPLAGRGKTSRTIEVRLDLSPLAHFPRIAGKWARWVISKLLLRKKLVFACAAILLVVGILSVAVYISRQRTVSSDTGSSDITHQPTGPTPGTPSYATVLPSGKSIASLGGWYRVSPPGRNPVYAYADKIGSVEVDVSEQPLPDSFTSNTADSVAQLAQSFNANQKLTVEGLTVYIGTSAKGPQSLIFTKNKLLILIKSTTVISNDQWVGYISSLQ